MHRTIILLVVSYECGTWLLSLREELGLRVCENRVLRRICGPKRDEETGEMRKLRNEELNPLTPNDHYTGRTAPLTSKRCILYIYSTNTGTEYFKHGIYSPFFSLQNAVCFIIITFGSCIIHILYTGMC